MRGWLFFLQSNFHLLFTHRREKRKNTILYPSGPSIDLSKKYQKFEKGGTLLNFEDKIEKGKKMLGVGG